MDVGLLEFKQVTEMKIAEFANSVDPDEAAHKGLSHLDLQFAL